jgi:hypothetical protein
MVKSIHISIGIELTYIIKLKAVPVYMYWLNTYIHPIIILDMRLHNAMWNGKEVKLVS